MRSGGTREPKRKDSQRVAVTGSWNFISTEPRDCVTLRFSKGVLRCSVFGPAELTITDEAGQERSEAFDLPENIQLHLIENVVASIRTKTPALSTGSSALRTNQVIGRGGSSIAECAMP